MNLPHWECCGRHYSGGIKACKICKLGRKVAKVAKDGIEVTRDGLTDEQKSWQKKQRKIQAKIPPGTEERLFTSTLPKEDDDEPQEPRQAGP